MKNFDIAVNLIFDHEGGYINDPKDPGGETLWFTGGLNESDRKAGAEDQAANR